MALTDEQKRQADAIGGVMGWLAFGQEITLARDRGEITRDEWHELYRHGLRRTVEAIDPENS